MNHIKAIRISYLTNIYGIGSQTNVSEEYYQIYLDAVQEVLNEVD